MSNTYIYALKDPRDNSIYYVGKSDDPSTRLQQHIKEHSTNRLKSAWIADLKSDGLRPELHLLETVDNNDWQQAEIHWIKVGRQRGWPLVNMTHGGAGYSETTTWDFMRYYVDPAWKWFDGLPTADKNEFCVSIAQVAVEIPSQWLDSTDKVGTFRDAMTQGRIAAKQFAQENLGGMLG